MMRKSAALILALGVLGVGVGVGTVVHAGYYNDYRVYVYNGTTKKYAAGVITATRTTTDTSQYIYCHTEVYSNANVMGWCSAKSYPSLTTLTCQTSDLQMIEQMRSISDSSYVYFATDSTGICTSVNVSSGSPFVLVP